MTQRRRQSFQFHPEALDELAAVSGLDRKTAEFASYVDSLAREVERSRARHSLPRDWVPSAKAHRNARAVAQKAAALLAELKQLPPSDRALLLNLRTFLDLGAAEKLTASERARKWRSQLIFTFLSARQKRAVSPPRWLHELIAELGRLQRVAEAAAHIKKPTHPGRQADSPRIIFGRQIASAFYWHLQRRPTKGRNSAFERTLRVCLAAVGEYPGDPNDPRDLHTLIATVLDGMNFDRRVPIIRLVP